jgi:hypothetical protein
MAVQVYKARAGDQTPSVDHPATVWRLVLGNLAGGGDLSVNDQYVPRLVKTRGRVDDPWTLDQQRFYSQTALHDSRYGPRTANPWRR